MTEQNPLSPRPKRIARPGQIIDDEMPRRMIVQLDTHDISADQYEAAVREWLTQSSPPTLAFSVARAILQGIVAAR